MVTNNKIPVKNQPPKDTFKEFREWEHKDYAETCDPELTKTYNGFAVEVRFSCTCDIYEDATCGLKLFIITSKSGSPRYFTDSCIYPNETSAFNAATEAIDNREIPE